MQMSYISPRSMDTGVPGCWMWLWLVWGKWMWPMWQCASLSQDLKALCVLTRCLVFLPLQKISTSRGPGLRHRADPNPVTAQLNSDQIKWTLPTLRPMNENNKYLLWATKIWVLYVEIAALLYHLSPPETPYLFFLKIKPFQLRGLKGYNMFLL